MPDLWSGFLFLHISNGEYGESTFYNFILASSGFFLSTHTPITVFSYPYQKLFIET